MPIDLYYHKFSGPCRGVLMTAKQLGLDINIKVVDLTEGEHKTEAYLKLNPAHTIPCIDDDGFILWESRAIMQYLCNKYAPDSALYPTDLKERALVDRWLNFDATFVAQLREVMAKPMITGTPPSEMGLKALKDNIKLLDTLIAGNKYLVGNHLTIADLSLLPITQALPMLGFDITQFTNYIAWRSGLEAELPYYDEVNTHPDGEQEAFFGKMKEIYKKMMENTD